MTLDEKIKIRSSTIVITENFKNFEVQFDDYCIQANYGDITKDPVNKRDDFYKQPILETSALRSALPDKALLVLR